MSSTPDDAAAAPEPTSPEGPSIGELIAGGEPQGSPNAPDAEVVEPRTLDGKEVAPLRDTYPTRGNGWIALGVGLFLVAIMFATADVTVSKRPTTITQEQQCGTWLKHEEPEDKDWIGACEDAYGQRTWMVLTPVLVGLVSLGYGASLRIRRRG